MARECRKKCRYTNKEIAIFFFQIVGLIVPPLPPQSGADPHSAENRTKKQFGSSARAMLGDDYKLEAKNLERFLQLMLSHPVFGRDKHLEEFLMQKHPPIRARIKKGFLAGMKESLDIRKTSGIKDSDDFFQKEREWAFAYGKNIRDAVDCFNNLMYAQLRFANQVNKLKFTRGKSLLELWVTTFLPYCTDDSHP